MRKASIVLGLQFGDEGKGKTVQSLIKQTESNNNIVIRFSGGQQAGHTVINNNIKHICSNYGSGVLLGVPTYFTEHTTFYPVTIYNEKKVLHEKGIKNPVLIIHPFAKITTPADVAFNRVLEKRQKHGSCGLGIGTTMSRNINTGYKLYAYETIYSNVFWTKVENITNYYRTLLNSDEISYFEEVFVDEMSIFKLVYRSNYIINDYNHLILYDHLIFEGSQGILLDMDHGFFPNVTYSNTTSKNAIEVCDKFDIRSISIYYVTRNYQHRHGNGWMSNENQITINGVDETNIENPWQGKMRYGELDYDLLNYAIETDNLYNKINYIYNKFLVVNWMDSRPDFIFNEDLVLKMDGVFYSGNPEQVVLDDIKITKE